MFNPTNCEPQSFSGTATSTEAQQAPIASHFQVGSCQSLKFKPKFKVSTTGKTSRSGRGEPGREDLLPDGRAGR